MRKFFHYYRRMLKFAMKYKAAYFLSLTATLILVFFNNFSVFILRDLTNALQKGENILRPILMIAAINALPLILEPLAHYPRAYFYANVVRDLMNSLYRKIMSLDYEFHTRKETGRLLSKLLNSDTVVRMYFWNVEWWVLENISSSIIPVILISLISKEIGLLSLVSIVLSTPFLLMTLKYNVKTRAAMKDADYARNGAVVDGITNYETVRLFARKKDEIHYVSKLVDRSYETMSVYQNSWRVMDFVARITGIMVFLLPSIYLYRNYKSFDLGGIVVIVTYLIAISNRMMALIFSTREIFKDLPLVEDVFEILDTRKSIDEPEKPVEIESPKGAVKLENVTFSYEGGRSVLKDINIDIKPGETVALVGPSGGGKSTIARLIMRYYDPHKGKVMIDGQDLKDLGSEGVNELIGAVPQEPILFNRSLKYNIGYALSPNEDDLNDRMDEIIDACSKAQIYEFIQSLPNGFDTVVGERGIKLSGGQKQRVAIARVILKNPKIIIFDEATSMLDSESESAIQKAFKELSKNTTTIVIAHRLSTIKNVDRIFVIDKGELVEVGNHEELVSKDGIYANLWRLQSSGFKKGKKT